MQVKLNWFVVYLIATALSLVLSNLATAQSVAVQVPGGRSSPGLNQYSAWPPNSMSAEMRRWEAILDRTYPTNLNGTMYGRELIDQLNQLGLPITLTNSARDDSLDDENSLRIPLPGSSLRTRLLVGLGEKNATIYMRANRIGIISLDDTDDYQHFLTLTYDVTQLVEDDPYRLVDSITDTVDPDAWQDTGQGLGTIVHNTINGRDLITIGQSYEGHRGVQKLLSGVNQLSGASSRTVYRKRNVATPHGSRAVSLPSRKIVNTVNSGVGVNSYQGGGVFSVPNRKPSRR